MDRILVIDDEEYIGWVIKKSFEGTENEVSLTLTGEEGLLKLKTQSYDVVLLDLRLPDKNGMEILQEIKKLDKNIPVIIITAHGSIDTAIESMKNGACDYITKPFDIEELILKVQKALEVERLKGEIDYLRIEAAKDVNTTSFTSNNERMNNIYKALNQIADTTANVLITGESGAGKELIARRTHQLSSRSAQPFIVFNCGALSEDQVERELFGFESINLNGNFERKPGKFELAHKGTIFLDEVGDMSTAVQAKLLSFLERKEFQRFGSNSNIKVDVRIIASSNKNLIEAIEKGEFREDFYYRLKVVHIEIPPLRERKEDISTLIDNFLKRYDSQGKIKGVTTEAMKLLKNYHWPGNIRELQNMIERLVILNNDDFIRSESLPIEILDKRKRAKGPIIYFPEEGINLEEVEKELIIKALKICDQNQSRAAQLLSITRSALIYRMQKYQI